MSEPFSATSVWEYATWFDGKPAWQGGLHGGRRQRVRVQRAFRAGRPDRRVHAVIPGPVRQGLVGCRARADSVSLRIVLTRTQHVLLDFDGPMCNVFSAISCADATESLG